MAARRIRFSDFHPPTNTFRKEVLDGLSQQPKRIAPKFFYDSRGSELFDAICALPEYYPTRTEIDILKDHAAQIASLTGPNCRLIEFGSGNSHKVRLLLETLRPAAYLPMDIACDQLSQAAQALADIYPWLEVHATCIDFSRHFVIPPISGVGRKLAFFPGSSIGNFEPDDTIVFLRDVARTVEPDGALLIGVDLKKDPRVLHAAYNDVPGITAQFNLNLLTRINRELDGNFVLENFAHLAFYNQAHGRIEMHLTSLQDQDIRIGDDSFHFARGEHMHTENSYKYDITEFQDIARKAGFEPTAVWTDPGHLFSVHYLNLGRY